MQFYTYCGTSRGKILHRYVKDGKRYSKRTEYEPMLYVDSDNIDNKYSNMFNSPVKEITFSSIFEYNTFIKDYKDVESYNIYGETSDCQFISDTYHNKIDFDSSQIMGYIFDIEVYTPRSAKYGFPDVNVAPSPVVAISVYCTIRKQYYVWGIHPREVWSRSKSKILDKIDSPINYIHCSNEIDLLKKFIDFWSSDHPDFISGWNTNSFDIPYLYNRIEKVFSESESSRLISKLSPFKNVYTKTKKDSYGRETTVIEIVGVSHLDYLEIYKKHVLAPRESYTLDYIAETELGERKLSYDCTINELYERDYQHYIDYNIRDSNLVVLLDEKLKLFDLTFSIAYYAKCNYKDTLGTVRIWEILIYNFLKGRNKVPPLFGKGGDKDDKYIGAFVRTPVVGHYKWVVSLDLASMYPMLIQQYNVGAETIIEKDQYEDFMEDIGRFTVDDICNESIDTSKVKGSDYILAANCEFYSNKNTSVLSSIMKDLYNERKKDKGKMMEKKRELQEIESEIKKRNL